MNTPLVSIVCLCHNQSAYVGAAIRSVFSQTYQHLELIVVDDASTDGSQEAIKKALQGTSARFIALEKNEGNCTAFNKGYLASTGSYLIDLAADDLLLPKRVEEGVNDFTNASSKHGIHFSDAFMVDTSGAILHTFYERDSDGNLVAPPPSGDVFEQLIQSYFICPPTMMMKREVLDQLQGYDESLTYEDFDFWIRSSRQFHYLFSPAPLVKKRDTPNSLSKKQFALRSKHFLSTHTVCQKALGLCQHEAEFRALRKRCLYEIRQCVKTLNFGLIPSYYRLLQQSQRRLSSPSSMDR